MVSNHDELMCNFFAQADALAIGKVCVLSMLCSLSTLCSAALCA